MGSCVKSHPAEAETLRASAAKNQSQPSARNANVRAVTAPETTATLPGTEPANPPKVQEGFQKDFAREVAAAGPKAEGWALFSDGGMSYPGQRWLIRTNSAKKDSLTLCVIMQSEKTCTRKAITKKQFDAVAQTFTQADKLAHILPTSFDGMNFEYLHAKTGVPTTNRVVFLTSATPFPTEYEAIVLAFKTLTEAK